MKVCANCFKDEEIKRFIESLSNESTRCDCCGKHSKVIDLDELLDFFEELLKLFVFDDNGMELAHCLQYDWEIFSSNSCARKILSEIMYKAKCNLTMNGRVAYLPTLIDSASVWDELKVEVKENHRYFYNTESYDWETLVQKNIIKLSEATCLYRSRITPVGLKKLKMTDMGCPPSNKAIAGRANPIGIPYLYLCGDKQTTFYEIRAVYLDRVSVGLFRPIRELNIVDFDKKNSLFVSFSDERNLYDAIVRRKIQNKISEDLSKPLRRFDTEVEYVPTQLICEYCKQNGADGVRFKSSLHKGGNNIVLFNASDAECFRVYDYEIVNTELKAQWYKGMGK